MRIKREINFDVFRSLRKRTLRIVSARIIEQISIDTED